MIEPGIVLRDSVTKTVPGDVGCVLVTGSHGGLPGPDPAAALKVDALAAVYNDAGIGRDGARRQTRRPFSCD